MGRTISWFYNVTVCSSSQRLHRIIFFKWGSLLLHASSLTLSIRCHGLVTASVPHPCPWLLPTGYGALSFAELCNSSTIPTLGVPAFEILIKHLHLRSYIVRKSPRACSCSHRSCNHSRHLGTHCSSFVAENNQSFESIDSRCTYFDLICLDRVQIKLPDLTVLQASNLTYEVLRSFDSWRTPGSAAKVSSGGVIGRTLSMASRHGTELVQGAIYEFHKPDPGQRIQVEIVFMHGLQVNVANLKDAYYKTWRTSDGKEVWPETWLKDEYPNARILSLAYDSSARKTGTAGNMGPYLLGESLLHQMVSTAGNIGQNDCPVVFVCHSLGGLIAKEIVVRCRNSDRANAKYQNLLHNMKAVFFYATPHGGSDLAVSWISKIADWFPFVEKSSLVRYLNPKGTDRTHIHADFLQAVNKDNCKFYVVAEGRESKIPGVRKLSTWIVRENSARFPGPHEFVMLKYADHMTVCKPQSKDDTGYLKLINCIDQVIEEYRRRITVDLSVNPIGIEGKIDKVSKLLESSEVSIVGLFGMGGVGKTTMSKRFYNLKAFKYVKSCYLENVKSRGVQDVQKELLRGLCGRQLSQDERVEKQHLDMIKDCFLTEKVLVVLDDVSSGDCLRELQVFHALETGSQSKVVVTGRDKAILPKKYLNSGKAVIEPVNGIKDPEGSDLQLFLRHAFEAVDEDVKEEVNTELLGEATKIVQLCNGLPLSLEVIGTYLGNSEYEDLQQWKETWADAYVRLQKAQNMGDDKLWSSLRISYDHLGDVEQKMFLDFACIFSQITVEKRLVERIWGSIIGVQNLVNKSLLKEEGGCFVMHDQLRDMGRHMLLKEALKDYQHPIYLLEGPKYLSKTYMEFKKLTTESGVPYIASLELQEVGKSLHQYCKLRLLSVTGWDTPSLVDECLSQCSGDLRWLRLEKSEVTEIGIQKLCSFGGLRVLQIVFCDNIVKLPEDIGKLANLVEMEVHDCSKLQSLPDTIGKLKNLKRLVIADCSGLRVVPDSVGELSEVEYLSFEGCDQLTVIHGTQICTQKLMTLKLPIMPTTCLRPCPQLRRFDIEIGQGVKEFPQDFFKIDMPKLEVVNWSNDHSVEVALKNPDGSERVLKNSFDNELEVERNDDGSISRLIDVLYAEPESTQTLRRSISWNLRLSRRHKRAISRQQREISRLKREIEATQFGY